MDPISLLIGALVLTACAKVGIAATTDAITTARASKAGEWDWLSQDRERRSAARRVWASAWAERRRARHKAAGGDGEFRPGAREYAADLYHGFWEDRLERRSKKRAGRPEYVYDPDRPPWHRRFDDALLSKVERLRGRWGQYRADRQPVEDTPLDELLDREPEPVAYAPGVWTVGDDGERVDLAPAEDSWTVWPDWTDREDEPAEHQGVVDAIYGTTETTGGTMTTPAAAVATEVQTNEDARRCFAAMGEAAAEAAEALAALEAARAKMAAAAFGAADGMATQRFDAGATAAANEAVDAVGLDTLAGWADKIDAVSGAATKGLAGLEKYRDAEDTVASNNVDASTLSAMSS